MDGFWKPSRGGVLGLAPVAQAYGIQGCARLSDASPPDRAGRRAALASGVGAGPGSRGGQRTYVAVSLGPARHSPTTREGCVYMIPNRSESTLKGVEALTPAGRGVVPSGLEGQRSKGTRCPGVLGVAPGERSSRVDVAPDPFTDTRSGGFWKRLGRSQRHHATGRVGTERHIFPSPRYEGAGG